MAKPVLSDLLAQKALIEKQIANMRLHERADTIAKIKSLMAEYGLTVADIAAGRPAAPPPAAASPKAAKATKGPKAAKAPKPATKKVAPKYADKATGQTWSGRGLKPRWLTAAIAGGKSIDDFKL